MSDSPSTPWTSYLHEKFQRSWLARYGIPQAVASRDQFVFWPAKEDILLVDPAREIEESLRQHSCWDGVVTEHGALVRGWVADVWGNSPTSFAEWILLSELFNLQSLEAEAQPVPLEAPSSQAVWIDFLRDFFYGQSLWLVDSHLSSQLVKLAAIAEKAGATVQPIDETNWQRCLGRMTPTVVIKNGDSQAVDYPNGWLVVNEKVNQGWTIVVEEKSSQLFFDSNCVITSTNLATIVAMLEIASRKKALLALDKHQQSSELPISVVVCTYQRPDLVKTAIEALQRQTVSRSDFEVVIVNNDPWDAETRYLLDKAASEWGKNFRVLDCPVKGLSAARNAGWSIAQGEVVAFLDDDAVPEPDWLHHLLAAFREHPDAGVIGGRVNLRIPSPRPPVLTDGRAGYWSQFTPEESAFTLIQEHWKYPVGANWAARRTVLSEIGGFRQSFGRRGKDFSGGEELLAARLAHALGYGIAYEPKAVVEHRVAPDRFTYNHWWRSIRSGIEASRMADIHLAAISSTYTENVPSGVGRLTKFFRLLFAPDRWLDVLAYWWASLLRLPEEYRVKKERKATPLALTRRICLPHQQ